ncbi:MAG: hypothetical protein IKP72_12790, partial [Clostridia bacterium]|nr:hypothetical protein [Clostridia bacterium]
SLEGRLQESRPLALKDVRTGKLLPTQTGRGPRGQLAEAVLYLQPGESRDLQMAYDESNQAMPPHTAWMGADAVFDLDGIPSLALPDYIETDFFLVRTDEAKGVASIMEKRTGQELIDPNAKHGAFTCLYQITPGSASRRQMGRRRETVNTRQYAARPKRFAVIDRGDVSVTLRVEYDLEGAEECALELKIYRHLPRMDARVRIKKLARIDPEEVQVALPFRTDGDNETWIDKTGCVVRPGIDQLPGTCQAFWCLQNGVLRRGSSFDLLICCPDAPLVSLGEEKKGPVALCDGRSTELNRAEIRSRVMNNYWETNFSVDLGGWHEFRYVVTLEKPNAIEEQFKRCAVLSAGFPILDL